MVLSARLVKPFLRFHALDGEPVVCEACVAALLGVHRPYKAVFQRTMAAGEP